MINLNSNKPNSNRGIKDNEILVNSYVRKKSNALKNRNNSPIGRMLGKVNTIGGSLNRVNPLNKPNIPKPRKPPRSKGVKNNKYNFNLGVATRFRVENKLSKFKSIGNKLFQFKIQNRLIKFKSIRDKYISEYKMSWVTKEKGIKNLSQFKRMSWSTREKISNSQRENNSNYKHGNRLDYRHISNWIPNEVIHHIDGNHNNNHPENLISIPGYIPDIDKIKTLDEWKRIVNCKIHEEIHRRASKDENYVLPDKDKINELIESNFPKYFEEVRPKLEEHYKILKIKDRYIEGNNNLENRIDKVKQLIN